MEHQWNSQRKNREAEESHVRKSVWGSGEENQEMVNEDEMNQTVLGDINHPAPVVMQQPQSNTWPIVAGLALASLLPTAGFAWLAGYLLSKPDQQIESPEFDDETVSVGLGRIEDYLSSEKEN